MQVSIVIPTFNRATTIGEAVESAIAELNAEREIVVVDDGSTDNTLSVLARYGDRIRIVRQQNTGVSSARNHGIAVARGRYTKFLDSDDLLVKGSIDALLAHTATSCSDQLIPFGDAVAFDCEGRRKPRSNYGFEEQPEGALPRSVLLSGVMSPWLPLFPTAALRSVGGFRPELSYGEDQELALRLSASEYTFFHRKLGTVQVRDHGTSRLSRTPQRYARLSLATSLIAATAGCSLSSSERTALGRWIWSLARLAARSGDKEEAERIFTVALQLAGRNVWNANLGTRLLYRVISPVKVESILQLAKQTIRER